MSSDWEGESIRVRTAGDIAVVGVHEQNLDDACPRLSAEVEKLLQAKQTDIVLDLGSVSVTGNRGAGELLHCFMRVRSGDGRLRVHRAPRSLRALIAQTKLEGTIIYHHERGVIASYPLERRQDVDERPPDRDHAKSKHGRRTRVRVPVARIDILDGEICLLGFRQGDSPISLTAGPHTERFVSLVKDAVDQGFALFIFDLTNISRINSIALGALVHSTLSINQPSDKCAWVLSACFKRLCDGMVATRVWRTFDTIDEAISYLRTRFPETPRLLAWPWRWILKRLGLDD